MLFNAKKFLSIFCGFLLLPLVLIGGDNASIAHQDEPPEPPYPPHFPRLCRRFARILERDHYLNKPFSETISAAAWTNYLSHLDYSRKFFTAKDIERFEPYRLRICADLKDGDLAFPMLVTEIFKKRVKERCDYVEVLLSSEMDFSVKEDYTWKREDAAWCADEAELNELWRKIIKDEQLVRKISADYAKVHSTNKVDEVKSTNTTESVAMPPPPTPKEMISKRYKRYCSVIQDNDYEWMLESYLNAVVGVYDPHSAYMAPLTADDFDIDMNLKLCGIGATLMYDDGAAKITELIPGGPAERDLRDIKLQKGDKIIGVGQGDGEIEDTLHLPLNKIVKRIRGEKGTRVRLLVVCASDPSGQTTKIVDLVRDNVKLEEQAATGRIFRVSSRHSGEADKKRAFGYIRLPSFYGSMSSDYNDPDFRSAAFDVQKHISRMNEEIEGLVFDLRTNGGGSLREAIHIVGSFIRTGPVVLVDGDGHKVPLNDTDPAITFRKPLVVLVDHASASASEIVSAALQDYGRAVIIGDTKTHGKGSVQTVMNILNTDESYGQLRLTTSKFFRITGDSTQLKGVESDIVIPSLLEYVECGEEKMHFAMPWTHIEPSSFKPTYPLAELLPELAQKSKERLSANEGYQEYLKKVLHVKERVERHTYPLDYESRYALWEYDQSFSDNKGEDLINIDEDAVEKEPKEEDEGDEPSAKDFVLCEAVEILADLVDMQGSNAIKSSHSSTLIEDFILNFLQ